MSLCCRYGGSLILFLSLLRCPDSVFYSGSCFSPPVLSLFLPLLFSLSFLLPFLPCLYTWHLFCFPFLCSPCLVVFFLCHCSFSFFFSRTSDLHFFCICCYGCFFFLSYSLPEAQADFYIPCIRCAPVQYGILIAVLFVTHDPASSQFFLPCYPSSPLPSSFSGLIRLLIYRISFFISSRISNFAVSSVSSV